MRILFLNPTGEIGGAEAALLELLTGLRELQPSWSLRLLATSDGPLLARAAALGVQTRVLPFPPALARLGEWGLRHGYASRAALAAKCARAAWPARGYMRQLRHTIQEFAPDLVHTNGLKMHLLGAWARPEGTAVLWHMHDYVRRRGFSASLLRRCAHRCSAVVANSESVANDVRHVCRPLPVRPIWNAVDLTHFSPIGPKLDLDQLSGLPAADDDVVRVGLVATFARWKGHSTFLQALAMLPQSPVVRGYVVGGPVYETEGSQVNLDHLRLEAAALGLACVGFTGFVPDPAPALRALDIVVHASAEPEPFGLVIAEAMACGKAVVASQSGGAAELVTDGVDALAHTPGDVAGLASRIAKLASDQELRRRLGHAARATAERCFTRRRLASEFIPIYQYAIRQAPDFADDALSRHAGASSGGGRANG